MTDLHAKGLDGLRLAQRIRAEADTCEIPILIMTVVTDPPLVVSLRARRRRSRVEARRFRCIGAVDRGVASRTARNGPRAAPTTAGTVPDTLATTHRPLAGAVSLRTCIADVRIVLCDHE